MPQKPTLQSTRHPLFAHLNFATRTLALLWVALLAILGHFEVQAQTGYAYVRVQPGFMGGEIGRAMHLQHFGSDFKYSSATYAQDGKLYYSYDNILLRLSGSLWQSFPLPRYIASLAHHDGKIYAGCVADFGVFDPANKQYTSLRPLVPNLKDIDYVFSKVVAVGDRVCFYDERTIAVYNPATNSVKVHQPSDGTWDGIFHLGTKIFLLDYPKGLFQLDGDKLSEVALEDAPPLLSITASANPDAKTVYLLGCAEITKNQCKKALYVFDGSNFELFNEGSQAQELIKELDITHLGVTSSKIVLADKSMGAFVFLRQTGTLLSRISQQSGLASNIINSLQVLHGNVVVFGHEKELSFAYIELGVNDFSAVPGLVGKVNTFVNLSNMKLVGTDDGIYRMEQVSEKVNIKSILSSPSPASSPNDGKKKKTIKKKNQPAATPAKPATQAPKNDYELQDFPNLNGTGSLLYHFRKVEGFNTPCRKLLVHRNYILAFGTGVVYIYGLDLKLKAKYNFQTAFSEIEEGEDGHLYVAYNGLIQVFAPIDIAKIGNKPDAHLHAVWSVPTKDQMILSHCLAPDGMLWFTTENGVYHVEPMSEVPIDGLKPQVLANAESNYQVWRSKSDVFALAGNVVYKVEPNSNKLVRVGSLGGHIKPGDIVRTNRNGEMAIITKHDKATAYTVYVPHISDKGIERVDTVRLLRVMVDDSDFQELDEAGWLWVGWRNKLLYLNLRSQNPSPTQTYFKVFISNVSVIKADTVVEITNQADPDFERGINVLRFELTSNGIYNPERVTYYVRYDDDEEWAPVSGRIFSAPMSHGSYDLQVMAINVFGQQSDPTTYSFSIPPPWYRSWLFYIFLILSGLGITYYIIRQREARSRREQKRLKEYGDEMRALALQEQDKRIEAEKLGVLGSLVANVAHELNTPLGAIKGSIGHLDETLSKTIENVWALAPSIPQELAPLVLKLTQQAAASAGQLSTREERQIRGQIEDMLSVHAIPHADNLARQFVRIGVVDGIADFLPLLRHPDAERFLNLAFEIGKIYKYVSTIKSASEKTDARVKALKLYTYQSGPSAKVEFDLVDNVASNIAILDNKLRSGTIEFTMDLQPVPELLGYPDRLGQVWINVVDNAIYALKNTGKIAVRSYQDGGYAIVEIEDNGPGIPPEIVERIFVRFFTTKPKGEGTGLGLDICRQIVEEHGGTFDVRSQPGQTIFIAKIPLKPKSA